MASLYISVPELMREWVQQRIDSGQHASVSDYVRDLIRQDQERAAEREAIVAALVEGEKSGISKRRIPEILEAVSMSCSGRVDDGLRSY